MQLNTSIATPEKWLHKYHELLVRSFDLQGFVTEFLDAPDKVPHEKTRSLCQTRGMFFLVRYAKLFKCAKSLSIASSIYQSLKRHYYCQDSQTWYKYPHKNISNDLYEWSFVLFALSHLYQASPQPSLKEELTVLSQRIEQQFLKDNYQALTHHGILEQNALMHLFEAFSTAFQATTLTCFKHQAQTLFSDAVHFFYDAKNALIAEYSLNSKTQRYEPGHSFEWASLILEAQALNILTKPEIHAKDLYQHALTHGLDCHGLVKPQCFTDNKQQPIRIWPMLEYMRYVALCNESEQMQKSLNDFAHYFIKNHLPIEYLDSNLEPDFTHIKSTTGYHLINTLQYFI